MPTRIKINDKLGANLITADAGPGSGIAKYLKGDAATFVASSQLALALHNPVTSLTGPLGVGMTFADKGEFGTSGVSWKFSAGAQITVGATQPGKELPGDSVFSKKIKAAGGEALVSVQFAPTLSAGLSAGVGQLQFGFSAGGTVAFRVARPFPASGADEPTLGEALQSLMTEAVIPGHVLDIAAMKEGDIGSVSGTGTLQFSASFDVAKAFNPLASVNLPLNLGKAQFSRGASLAISAGVSYRGEYQIRLRKLAGGKAQLGVYRSTTTAAEFGVDASLGVSATAGKTELLGKLMGLLGATEADRKSLAEAGLSDGQIDDIRNAVKASLDRSLAVSLSGQFSSSSQHDTMFEYEFTLPALGSDGVDALNQAIRGDLTLLTSADTLPPGVKLLANAFTEVKQKSTTWKLNFIGIVNVLSMSELVREGKLLFNAETGELAVADSITAKRLFVRGRPLEADTRKLHEVLLQSLMFTAAYRASGLQDADAEFGASMSYFEQEANANRQKISDYLDNFTGLGLLTEAEKTSFLAHPARGRASVFVDAKFDDAAFTKMFVAAGNKPRAAAAYEAFGRRAIVRLIQPGDPNDFRRLPMTDDVLWAGMASRGQANFAGLLPAPLNGGPALGIIIHDYTVIRWWSRAMADASKAVVEMKKFLGSTTKTGAWLAKDKTFLKLRANLGEALSSVASEALPDFLDAWGILVMDDACGNRAALEAILVTPGPILTRSRS